ncbi:ras-related protein Rab-32B-like [Trichogramma pretiosum]|uniref:Ras-related protein Rab n=1 Tax=Trichogramma kaykai TaxID=54128 RepID=A0ABD2XJJ7_9HYME|nr:ras-related protein Rab-32B-like [Trichogramma pretiosum]
MSVIQPNNVSPRKPRNELLLKALVIGDYGVGKTAIVRRYTEGKFSSNYKITIGADFAFKSIDWDHQTKVNLQLWDIAGHERFGYMTRVYYKQAAAAALVFDVNRVDTFKSLKKWLLDLREKVQQPDGSNIPVILLANKSDIQQAAVTTDQIVKFCKENEIDQYFLCSAKENTNIEEALHFMVAEVLNSKFKQEVRESITLRNGPIRGTKQACCHLM